MRFPAKECHKHLPYQEGSLSPRAGPSGPRDLAPTACIKFRPSELLVLPFCPCLPQGFSLHFSANDSNHASNPTGSFRSTILNSSCLVNGIQTTTAPTRIVFLKLAPCRLPIFISGLFLSPIVQVPSGSIPFSPVLSIPSLSERPHSPDVLALPGPLMPSSLFLGLAPTSSGSVFLDHCMHLTFLPE